MMKLCVFRRILSIFLILAIVLLHGALLLTAQAGSIGSDEREMPNIVPYVHYRYYLFHKDTRKIVGSSDRTTVWHSQGMQTTLKAIYDSIGFVFTDEYSTTDQYATYDLDFGFNDTRVYLLAGNYKYIAIEEPHDGGMIRPSVDAKGVEDTSLEALIITTQTDGTFKISRISANGELWVNVRDNGDLYSQRNEPGESGKFYIIPFGDNPPPPSPALTGAVTSYNPNIPATVQLLRDGKEAYKTTTETQSGSGQTTQTFTFDNVAPGDYTLVVTKPGHASYTVKTVAVGDEDVDLSGTRGGPGVMTLPCGDINGDGVINDNDLIILWQAVNYNKVVGDAANPLCDLNGDGMINDNDLIILWQAVNYNKGPVVVG